MDPDQQHQALITRRELFGRGAVGIGTAALAALLGRDGWAAETENGGGLPALPHIAPKAKHVLDLSMNGAPPHVAPGGTKRGNDTSGSALFHEETLGQIYEAFYRYD